MLGFLKWGLRHRRVLVKLYTLGCITWVIVVITICVDLIMKDLSRFSISLFLGYGLAGLILAAPPFLPLYYFYIKAASTYGKTMKEHVEIIARKKVLDPYLVSVKERIYEAESYFRGEKGISWGPVIRLFFDALMSTLQRLVIDIKGVKPIEELRKERKLYFDNLIRILNREGNILNPDDVKDLEILRDLRNRVVHEDYRPSKDHAIWAYNVIKRFISKYYPEVFE